MQAPPADTLTRMTLEPVRARARPRARGSRDRLGRGRWDCGGLNRKEGTARRWESRGAGDGHAWGPGGEAPRSPRSLRQPRRPVLPPPLLKTKACWLCGKKIKRGTFNRPREPLAGDRMRTKKTPGVGESWPRVRAGGPEWSACREPLALCEPRRNPRRPRASAEPPGSDSAHPRAPKSKRKGPCVSSLQAFSQPM